MASMDWESFKEPLTSAARGSVKIHIPNVGLGDASLLRPAAIPICPEECWLLPDKLRSMSMACPRRMSGAHPTDEQATWRRARVGA
jgi:hypothetical protein